MYLQRDACSPAVLLALLLYLCAFLMLHVIDCFGYGDTGGLSDPITLSSPIPCRLLGRVLLQ